jgi:hypothetical protein
MSAPPSEGDQEEKEGLSKLEAEELALSERLNYFGLTQSSASSSQIQGYINEINGFLARLLALRAIATNLLSKGRPAYSQKLEGLIQRVQYNLVTYQFAYNSRAAFERFQQNSSRPAGQF